MKAMFLIGILFSANVFALNENATLPFLYASGLWSVGNKGVTVTPHWYAGMEINVTAGNGFYRHGTLTPTPVLQVFRSKDGDVTYHEVLPWETGTEHVLYKFDSSKKLVQFSVCSGASKCSHYSQEVCDVAFEQFPNGIDMKQLNECNAMVSRYNKINEVMELKKKEYDKVVVDAAESYSKVMKKIESSPSQNEIQKADIMGSAYSAHHYCNEFKKLGIVTVPASKASSQGAKSTGSSKQ